MTAATACASAAAALAVAGAWEALAALERAAVVRAFGRAIEPLRAARRLGRAPARPELRRLAVLAALAGLAAGWLVAGSLAGVLLALGGPSIAARAVAARRDRWRREAAAGAAPAARALADGVGAGRALRAAVGSSRVPGAAGALLAEATAALAAGATTPDVLIAVRDRAAHPAWDAIVATALLHRETGGDLAAALRDVATGLEDAARLEGEARAATAQARLTAQLVLALPTGAVVLGELAAPGTIGRTLQDPRSLALVVVALVLQVAAAVAIRRLARP